MRGRRVETVAVGLKSAVEASAPAQHVRGHERRRLIPVGAQHLCQRPRSWRQHKPAVVAQLMVRRVLSRQDRRMRGRGQRRVRRRVHERDAAPRQTVQIWRRRRHAAINSYAIRSERVDSDEKHVGWRHGSIRRPPCTATQETRCHLYRDEQQPGAPNSCVLRTPPVGPIRSSVA